MGNDSYQLRLFGNDGREMSTFPVGKVKANSEVVFYIVDGWYGTIISKIAHVAGNSADFSDLVTSPSRTIVESTLGRSCLGYLV